MLPELPWTGAGCTMCSGRRATRLRTALETASDLGPALRGATSSCTRTPRTSSCATSAEPSSGTRSACRTTCWPATATIPTRRSNSNGCGRTDLPGCDVRRARSPRWVCSRTRAILEIGSYVGSFLTLAGELGCDAVGVDVGREVVAFTRARGLAVCDEPFSPSVSDRGASTVCGSSIASNSFLTRGQCSTTSRRSCGLADESSSARRMRTSSAAYQSECEAMWRMLDANGLLGVPFVSV